MAIQKYALIDHVGSLTSSENKKVYKKVFTQAKADELTAYTIRKACLMDSPYAREVTSAMKYRIRYQKNPTKVYLICDTLDSTVESVLNIWESRNIPVELFEVNGFIETHKIDLGEEPDRKRKIAETWAPAIGWQFSAPVTRISRELIPENFSERPERKQLRINPELATVDPNETHFTKPFTNAETFLEMNRCVATDREIDEFYTHLRYLWNNKLIEEFLEPDYILCKECHRPMRIHIGECECPHCQSRFAEDIILDVYYEDSFDDSEE